MVQIKAMMYVILLLNKCSRNPKVQLRTDNSETLATLGTQDTGRRQNKEKTQNTEN